MAKIGFIGLGHMGGPMAVNLLKAGHSLTVYDVTAVTLPGVVVAANLAELIQDVDYVVSMLPAGTHVREVYLGAEGLLAHAPKAITYIECSTIDVETAKAVHAAIAQKGGVCVDAPVSGGTASAAAGTLTFMVGGSNEAYAQVKPILEAMGKKIFHAGLAGCGQMAKICNNLLLGISMIGVCEAFNLGKALGLEPQAFFDICKEASGQCWSLTQYCPVPGILPHTPANKNYEPGFMGKMMLKDLNLAEDAADSVAAATPLGDKARDLYQAFCDAGGQDKDFSGIIEWLQRQ
jgi:3-hydroxyisobutyrate dehydrogenase